jgi:hypothetical protein
MPSKHISPHQRAVVHDDCRAIAASHSIIMSTRSIARYDGEFRPARPRAAALAKRQS